MNISEQLQHVAANLESADFRPTLTEVEICRRAVAEIARLQEAKRRALAVADERSRENVELRAEIARLRARLRPPAASAESDAEFKERHMDCYQYGVLPTAPVESQSVICDSGGNELPFDPPKFMNPPAAPTEIPSSAEPAYKQDFADGIEIGVKALRNFPEPAGAPSEAARWKAGLEAIRHDPSDARNVARAALGDFD